jgi:hypothetical protein
MTVPAGQRTRRIVPGFSLPWMCSADWARGKFRFCSVRRERFSVDNASVHLVVPVWLCDWSQGLEDERSQSSQTVTRAPITCRASLKVIIFSGRGVPSMRAWRA